MDTQLSCSTFTTSGIPPINPHVALTGFSSSCRWSTSLLPYALTTVTLPSKG